MEPFASEDAHIVEERRNTLIVKFREVIAKTWEVSSAFVADKYPQQVALCRRCFVWL